LADRVRVLEAKVEAQRRKADADAASSALARRELDECRKRERKVHDAVEHIVGVALAPSLSESKGAERIVRALRPDIEALARTLGLEGGASCKRKEPEDGAPEDGAPEDGAPGRVPAGRPDGEAEAPTRRAARSKGSGREARNRARNHGGELGPRRGLDAARKAGLSKEFPFPRPSDDDAPASPASAAKSRQAGEIQKAAKASRRRPRVRKKRVSARRRGKKKVTRLDHPGVRDPNRHKMKRSRRSAKRRGRTKARRARRTPPRAGPTEREAGPTEGAPLSPASEISSTESEPSWPTKDARVDQASGADSA
jgi:hypothetical protein